MVYWQGLIPSQPHMRQMLKPLDYGCTVYNIYIFSVLMEALTFCTTALLQSAWLITVLSFVNIKQWDVEHPLHVWWVIGSIPPGAPIELFLIPASVLQLM